MKVKLKERLRFAIGGITVVDYEAGEQDLHEEAAEWALANGVATRVQAEAAPAADQAQPDVDAEGSPDDAPAPSKPARAGKKAAGKPIGDAS